MSERKGWELLGKGIVGTVALAIALPWWGWAAAKLWSWFIVPLGARPLHVFQACGIALTAHFFIVPGNLQRTDEKLPVALTKAFVGPLVFLGFGAFYRWLAS